MTLSLAMLLAFVVWTLAVVVVGIGSVRVRAILSGKAKPSAFVADQPHGSERYRRTMRAHANCVENLPLFASVVLTAAVSGYTSATFDLLAVVYFVGRVAQTLTHIASGRSLAVNVRFSFFAVQLVCLVTMVVLTAQHLASL